MVTQELLLMGPGPSPMHPRVREALVSPIRGIGDPDVHAAARSISENLRKFFGTANEGTMCVAASGMSGMEAGFANLIEPGDRAVVCCNGFFSNRLAELAERYGAEVTRLETEWGVPFDRDAITHALEMNGNPKLLALVMAETSTGMRNDIAGLADLAHRHGGLLLVDAVTALAGMPIEIDLNGVDYCFSGSQKCVGAATGLSPVTVSPRAWQVIESRKRACPSFYLDLKLIKQHWVDQTFYQNTPSSPLIFAMEEALSIAAEEGVEARFRRHRDVGAELKRRLLEMGLELWPDESVRLPMLAIVRLPDGREPADVAMQLRNGYHIEIGRGLAHMGRHYVRIGTMGHGAQVENVERVITALKAVL